MRKCSKAERVLLTVKFSTSPEWAPDFKPQLDAHFKRALLSSLVGAQTLRPVFLFHLVQRLFFFLQN